MDARQKGGEKITLFQCGPSKCEHDYSGPEELIVDPDTGEQTGSTATCSKCGARAIDEAAWL